jgi:flagellar biogenesis protein FliO
MKRVLYFLFSFLCCCASLCAADQQPAPAPILPPKDLNEPLYPYDLNKMEQHNSRFFSELLSMLATLGLVVAFLIAAAWILRRIMNTRIEQMNAGSRIKVVERRTLSPKSALYLVEIEEKLFLITEVQNGGSALELSRTEPSPPKSFKELL